MRPAEVAPGHRCPAGRVRFGVRAAAGSAEPREFIPRGADLAGTRRRDPCRQDHDPGADRRHRAERAAHGARQAQRAREGAGRQDRARARQCAGRPRHRLRARGRCQPADGAHALSRERSRCRRTCTARCSNPPRAACGSPDSATSCSSATAATTRRTTRSWPDNSIANGRAPRCAWSPSSSTTGRQRLALPGPSRQRGYSDAEIGLHAGLADTSLALAVDPGLVRAEQQQAAQIAPPPPGVSGDPRRATAELGKAGIDMIVTQSVAAIRKAVGPPVVPYASNFPQSGSATSGVFVTLHCSCSLPASRVAACPCVLDDQRRAGSGASAGGSSRCAGRIDRARHAAGRRSGESVQRDHRRQDESRARERPAARVRAARPVERRLRDRPGDVHGRRQVQGRPQPAARRAVVGPAHAVGGEQRREHDQGQPDAGRSQRPASPASRSPSTTRTTCTSRPTASPRSSLPRR